MIPIQIIIEVIDPLIHEYRVKKSYREATDPNRVAVLSPDMKRIRARQQEVAMQRSLEVEEERKKKKAEDRERKRVKSPEELRWEKMGGEGQALGGTAGKVAEEEGAALRRRRPWIRDSWGVCVHLSMAK